MLTIGASIIASLAGYLVDSLVEPFLGIGARIFIGIVVGAYVFVYARNWLRELRG